MNKVSKAIFVFMSIAFMTFLGARLSGAYFSDSGSSTTNTFQAAAVFSSPTPVIVNHLVITEVLNDTNNDQNFSGQGGANRGEFVEIHNPTSNPVNLTGWTVFDGSSSETLSGSLNAGGFLILTGASQAQFTGLWTGSASALFVQATDGTIGNGLSNGGGIIVLRNGATDIDAMSWGTNTTGFSSGCGASCPAAPSGQSFGRSPLNIDNNSATDFVINNPPNPGS